MSYNWQYKQWPQFKYDITVISDMAMAFSQITGEMTGVVQGLTNKAQQDALIRLMIEEALKSSAIEGELINRQDVMSSIRNNLGLNKHPENIKDKRAKAISELMIDVRTNYKNKLSENLIKNWHKLLFDGFKTINAGKWRSGKEPMQVVSGRYGKEIIHYEAPSSEKVAAEMKQFIQWYAAYKANKSITHAIAKTAIAHLYFESIHPFEDGNGRIGRAIAEKCLSESLGRPVLLSLSTVIERKRKEYYAALKEAQGSLNINNWLLYFAKIVLEAQKEAVKTVQLSLKKTKFFDAHKNLLNERELKVIKKMLDADAEKFIGGMTAKKYMSITKASKATATRDLQHLSESGILIAKGGGRNVHYDIAI